MEFSDLEEAHKDQSPALAQGNAQNHTVCLTVLPQLWLGAVLL